MDDLVKIIEEQAEMLQRQSEIIRRLSLQLLQYIEQQELESIMRGGNNANNPNIQQRRL